MYRFAIVEDNQEMAEELGRFIARYFDHDPSAADVTYFSNGLEFISDYVPNYDAVFMDIQMPEIDGMKAAEHLRKVDRRVCLVFVTMMVQYAVEGYKVDALSYLVKPVSYFPFSVVMDKIMERVHESETEVKLSIRSGSQLRRIYARDVFYVEVRDHYLIYHTREGEFSELGKMSELEERLQGQHFFRGAKCYLINLAYVGRMEGESVYVGDDRLILSRRRHHDFMLALNQFLGGKM